MFKQGMKLSAVLGPSSDLGTIYFQTNLPLNNGSYVKSITVEMEKGQCGLVPWARVKMVNSREVMVNIALLEQVDIWRPESKFNKVED